MNTLLVDPKALIVDHQNWLQNPVTQLLLKALDNHREQTISCLTAITSKTEKPEQDALYYATSLRNTEAIMKMIRSSISFVDLATKQ
jgi:hypothetical protein